MKGGESGMEQAELLLQILAEIRQQKGKQFDSVLADIFCEAMLYKKI